MPGSLYPIDPAIIPAFDRSGKANTGHLLETAVLIELERRSADIGYVSTPGGFEVDFLATEHAGRQMLIQVAMDLSVKATRECEFRALADALPAYRHAQALLLTLTTSDALAAKSQAPAGVSVRPVWEWILEGTLQRDFQPQPKAR